MKRGDIVTVHNHTTTGNPGVEGKAKLIRRVASGRWVVEFLNEPGEHFERYIKAEA